MNNLDLIVNFCENLIDCRRALQLEYFGEHFTREQCLVNRTSACDNCSRTNLFKEIDSTAMAKTVISAVKDLCDGRSRNTVLQMVELLKGASTKRIVDSGQNNSKYHGHMKQWERNDIQRIIHKLILDGYLREEIMINRDIAQAYVRVGPKVEELMRPGTVKKFMFAMSGKNQAKEKKMDVTAVDEQEDELRDRCYQNLMEVVKAIAEEQMLTVAQILNMQAIREMSKQMPETEAEMLQIPHITKANFDKYGKRFLEVTKDFSAQRLLYVMDKADEAEANEEHDVDWQRLGQEASTSSSQRSSGGKRKFGGNWGKASAKRYKPSKKKSPARSKKKSPAKKRPAAGKNLLPRPTPQF